MSIHGAFSLRHIEPSGRRTHSAEPLPLPENGQGDCSFGNRRTAHGSV